MSLSIEVRSQQGGVVIALGGEADDAMLATLQEPLRAALGDADVVVLDVDQLTSNDSTGLRDLIVDVLDTTSGGRLRIAASQPHAQYLLAEGRIHHLVPVHHAVADALAVPVNETVG